ncbi:flagellar hook-length control protein FliK [Pseudomonas sp. CDFA 602]|uniref:flagellar hook-length control protein FliK n=1 Tax=Pseudomonas californiensis TaxID=2829823 RepID=UPI001E5EF565|nr:flagellar hook-length control protein FliK [Pseudomonas californiensis]MCD5993011.1 flagellar hook-length control protein FliK [Pseudomonas californiensis]MCD5998388.1 flagellar hook-length control protein FliK [Pseudomonas californiensis]
MPLATNALLQANTTAASRSSTANNALKPTDSSKDGASSFSNVYAKQAKDAVPARDDVQTKAGRDKVVPDKDKVASGKGKPDDDKTAAADQSTVADSGNDLPGVVATADTDDGKADADAALIDAQAAADAQALADLANLNAQVVVDPAQDPALQAMAAQGPALTVIPVATNPVTEVKTLPLVGTKASAGIDPKASPLVSGAIAAPAVVEEAFNPDADPLDGLDAVQLALENASAKTQVAGQSTQAAIKATPSSSEADPAQNVANNLAALTEQKPSEDGSTESSDKSFSGLIGEGLKDVKSAAGDTRVDNFADRLAALSQAAQPARVAATPSSAPLMSQPLAMHQSGWTEGIVDRVMYLSSQNLKSADIKLEPAELGRLDIRVNMAPDQQTQVTFMSAHLGVRDALESQVSRLRESFVQQGLGQVDVNVSDQSQQQAQQQAQEQANRAQRGGRGSGMGSGDALDDSATVDAAIPVSQPAARVLGTSEIDYYA